MRIYKENVKNQWVYYYLLDGYEYTCAESCYNTCTSREHTECAEQKYYKEIYPSHKLLGEFETIQINELIDGLKYSIIEIKKRFELITHLYNFKGKIGEIFYKYYIAEWSDCDYYLLSDVPISDFSFLLNDAVKNKKTEEIVLTKEIFEETIANNAIYISGKFIKYCDAIIG